MVDPIVIVSYARTPMGGFQGALSGLKATELGAAAVRAAWRALASIQRRSVRFDPGFDGASSVQSWEEALWPGCSRERHDDRGGHVDRLNLLSRAGSCFFR